ncbi:phytoene/squalene synthase family protein [Tuwongella immobilis]|uniref:Uncharacterized protein n=1 Tax=Tuwongella immobilis TaxID=692036 RepID=A0A6C2YQE1_9BACT|nr:phytoene/squalene synthase family protein [Tuwongella immobilis]VIP03858.1 phytoene synthase : Probable phytoene synthase OS=Blastopirellula marina DSM 3645 GN=DSM3645_21317 PE=4 SV=1: SQS_PSY [Tuwongella immobilis]VTS05083.1 phytoene synthase : Probable phytoene synthase OS=Blastopirellula marina DSM 3645 GN=DSM3645_21317 PE=4 SV=1: SQS_PSY [Tuwongella immobilis]
MMKSFSPGCQRIRSQSFCRSLVRRSGSNLTLAFQVLSRRRREAMQVLYAFMRHTDDLADEAGDLDTKADRLDQWRETLHDALGGIYRHSIMPALHTVLQRYGVPPKYLFDVIDGVEMDLSMPTFATFPELYSYCYRVASAVGLASIHIWGFRGESTIGYAEPAGIAFQLTNILRDLGEDLANGRIYLPQDELARFHATPDNWQVESANYQALFAFQVDRARQFYALSEPLYSRLSVEGQAIFSVMDRTYRGLLEAIVARRGDVFSQRVRLPKWQKMRYLIEAFPTRWGMRANRHAANASQPAATVSQSANASQPVASLEVPKP